MLLCFLFYSFVLRKEMGKYFVPVGRLVGSKKSRQKAASFAFILSRACTQAGTHD